MICIYGLRNYDYISVHQNLLAHAVHQSVLENSFENDQYLSGPITISQTHISKMVGEIRSRMSTNEYLVWDARSLSHKAIHSLGQLTVFVNSNQYKGIILLFSSPELAMLTEQEMRRSSESGKEVHCIDSKKLIYCYGNTPLENEALSQFDFGDFSGQLNSDISRYIFEFLRVESSRPEPVASSNVYANRYFNAKRILCNQDLFNLVVYQLVLQVLEYIGFSLEKYSNSAEEFSLAMNKFDAFICASVNGACLASALAVFFKKPVIFLRNVGPSMTVSDDKLVNLIVPNRKYVFIFDFVCSGTEYHRVRMLCNIQRARLCYAFGISHYRYPSTHGIVNPPESKHMTTLFNINEYERYYKCFFDEDDCMNHIKMHTQQ